MLSQAAISPPPLRQVDELPGDAGARVQVGGRITALVDEENFELSDGTGSVLIRNIGGRSAAPRVGDIIVATGKIDRSSGEMAIACTQIEIKVRPDRPLPSREDWLGHSPQHRYRHREVDFLLTPELRGNLVVRAKVIRALRQVLDARGFLEVETPILLRAPDVAPVSHFVASHSTSQLYLRICPESYLKRLVVGGFGRVYEIGKSFRYETGSHQGLPEFTLMECYQAFAEYQGMAALTEELVASAAEAALGHSLIQVDGRTVDLRRPWKRVLLREAVLAKTGLDILNANEDKLRQLLGAAGSHLSGATPRWTLIDKVIEAHVQPDLTEPTFLMDYPVETICAAARHPEDPRIIERFEAYVGGVEIAHAFSELTDPTDQRNRMVDVLDARTRAGEEPGPLAGR
ncbi:MAG: amino acid--tRNA ligase-related protein [Gemmatimonadota bacterium]